MNTTILVIISIGVAILLDIAFVWYRRNHLVSHAKSNKNQGIQERIQRGYQYFSALNENIKNLPGRILTKEKFLLLKRLLVISLCIGIFVFGQDLMARTEPIKPLFRISEQINRYFRLNIYNHDNVFIGVIFLGLGAILLSLITQNIHIEDRSFSTYFLEVKKTVFHVSNIPKWGFSAILGCLIFAFLLWRISKSHTEFFDVVLWCTSISLLVIATIQWDRSNTVSLEIHLSNKDMLLILSLMILGLLINAYQLQQIPNALMGDEGTFFETANAIATGRYTPSPFDFGVFTFPVLSSIWQAAILRILGNGLWGWRFSAVIPTVLSVVPLYLLTRDLFGRSVGFISSLILVTLPYSLAFSRLGYNNSQSILTTTLCVWFLYLGVKNGSVFYLFFAGVASGLGFLTYTAGRIGIVIVLVFGVCMLFFKSNFKNQKVRIFLGGIPVIIGWGLMALPHLIYGYQKQSGAFRNKMLESVFFQLDYVKALFRDNVQIPNFRILAVDNHQLFFEPVMYFRLVGRGLLRTFLAFYHDDMIKEHFITGSILIPITAFFFSFGIIYIVRRLRNRGHLLIFIWLICPLVFLSILNTYPPRHQHLVPLIPVIALLTGAGIAVFAELTISWLKLKPKWIRSFRIGIIGLVTLLICLAGLQNYFVTMPKSYRPNLENFVSWYGLQHASDTQFLYLYTGPELRYWEPFLFRQIIPDIEYSSIQSDEVLRNQFFSVRPQELLNERSGIPLRMNQVIFFDYLDTEQIIKNLLWISPRARVLTVVDNNNVTQGFVILRGDLEFPMPAFLWEGIIEELSTPVMWIVIPLLLLLVYFLLKEIMGKAEMRKSFPNPQNG